MSEHRPDTNAPDAEGVAILRVAADELRERVDERWIEVADVLVSRALLASRPSRPIRAQASSGPIEVAERVLVSCLRRSVDQVADCEVVNIRVDSDGDVCTGVVVALAVRYGIPLLPLADRVRAQAEWTLVRLLGPVVPPVTVTQIHVHVADVVRGDPKIET